LMVTHERHIAERAERIVHLLDGEIERVETLGSPRRADGDDEPAVGTGGDGS
ncbi:MAG: ABC transporter ATP-binding protein, partial [Halobacteriales archaeon]